MQLFGRLYEKAAASQSDNAIQYSNKKSTVRVGFKKKVIPIIEVEDQGVGMVSSEVKKLFQNFIALQALLYITKKAGRDFIWQS